METHKRRFTTRELCMTAMGAALIAVCSWITIPAAVPFTLQTFAVCLVTGLLGLKCGFSAVLVFLLLGAVGVPVFSGFNAGIGHLFGTTGGYLIGFLFTALIVGVINRGKKRSFLRLLLSMVLGLLVCYAFGTAWFYLVYTRANGAVSLAAVLGWCVTPFLLPDAAKLLLAAFLTDRLQKALPTALRS